MPRSKQGGESWPACDNDLVSQSPVTLPGYERGHQSFHEPLVD